MSQEYLERKALVTGSQGLIGSAMVEKLCQEGLTVVGADNDSRKEYFGKAASTAWNKERLEKAYPGKYIHTNLDVTDEEGISKLFKKHKFGVVVHTAAQPSHDWAGKSTSNLKRDFMVNAFGTVNLLCAVKDFVPDAAVVFTSTNKVYGDNPSFLKGLREYQTRFDFHKNNKLYHGIDESLPLQANIHSFFGASKLSADVYTKEFGNYPGYNLNTGVFRGDCLTGSAHAAVPLHGFLNYVVRAVATGQTYTVEGEGGKQVRDNFHSLDVANLLWEFILNPKPGEIYNLAGGRGTDISVIEALTMTQEILGKKADILFKDEPRAGDHKWCIAHMAKARSHFPNFRQKYVNVRDILEEECDFVTSQLNPKIISIP